MVLNNFLTKLKHKTVIEILQIIKNRFFSKILFYVFQYNRVIKYKILSSCKRVIGKPVITQPVQLCGKGKIIFGRNVHIGCQPSPYLYNGYIYIEARNSLSKIEICDNVWINNNSVLISEGEGILIGKNSIFGTNLEIYDTDFHDLDPSRRMQGMPKTGRVVIGENVFAGSNVKILKGVSIGDNTVIANGSVVTKNIPGNVIAGGFPCKVIKKL